MHLSQRILIAALVTTMLFGSPINTLAAGSRGYGGNWPVTVSGSQFSNGTYCLTLTGNGRSGTASVVMGNEKYSYGSFVVVNRILMATIVKPSGSQNGALTFTADASHGFIGQGIFENIEGGSSSDVGALKFGMKGGC